MFKSTKQTIFRPKYQKGKAPSFVQEEGKPETKRDVHEQYVYKTERLYSTYFTGVKHMFGFFLEFELTKLEFDVLNMLLDTLQRNNIVFYSEDYFAETLKVHKNTIRKCMARLGKLNITRRISRREGYSLLRISPHLLWMGDQDLGLKILNEFPCPVSCNKERTELVKIHKTWIEETKQKELAHERLLSSSFETCNGSKRIGKHVRNQKKQAIEHVQIN